MAAGSWRLIDWRRRSSGLTQRPRLENHPVASRRCLDLIGRARLAGQLAERALRPAEPLAYGRGDAIACDLYRQAIQWALLAHEELGLARVAEPTSVAPAPVEFAHDALSTLWEKSDPELLAHAAGTPSKLQRLRSEILNKSFAEFAELEPKHQAELAERLQAFTEALLNPLDSVQRQLERLWFVRVVRLVGIAAAVGTIALAAHGLRLFLDRRNDLAPLASWSTSSSYPEGGCVSPQQRCPTGPSYFFHTMNEQDPWLLFDLGSEKTLSAVLVENRLDCCTERAVPLLVEVSLDKQSWKQVARRDSDFKTWRQRFPRQRARWVKLHVPTYITLHLAGVRLIP